MVVNGRPWRAAAGVTALAVAGETIVALGADREMRGLAAPGARILDAGGRTVIPAFNDAHVHFLSGARSLDRLDLSGAEDPAAVEAAIRDHLAQHPRRPWLIGLGWAYSAFPGGMPDRATLDRIVADRPAYLESYDLHTAWVNTAALRAAGVEAFAGEVLREDEMQLVERALPARTAAEDLSSLRTAMAMAAGRGVASVQEAGGGQDQIALYESLKEAGELTLRVRLGFDLPPGQDQAERARLLDGYQELLPRLDGRWISGGILKAFADGVVESRTAAMLEPYAGGGLGRPNWEWPELAGAARECDRRGWQVQVHAIGDAAVRAALNAFRDTAPGRRHRVEHVETIAEEDVPLFAELGVVASMQPAHAEPVRNLLEAWAPQLGPERASRGWPWRSIADAGGRLAFGSDWPVVPVDPARAIRVASTMRKERLTPDAALEAQTLGAAYAEHADGWKGRLAPGYAADIVVLDGETVAATVVGGRVVYEAS